MGSKKGAQVDDSVYKAFFDASPAYCVAIGADGLVRAMNRAMLDALAIDESSAIGSPYLERFVPESDRARTSDVMGQIARTGSSTTNVNRIVSSDGSERYVQWQGRPIFGNGGEFDFIIGVGQDITDLMKANLAAVEAHEQMLTLTEGMDLPVYVSDPDTYRLYFANGAMRRFFGEPGTKPCYEYIYGSSAPCEFCPLPRIFGPHPEPSCAWDGFNPANGHWYHCVNKAIRWTDGRLVNYGIAVDIDGRKRAEDERRRLEEESVARERRAREQNEAILEYIIHGPLTSGDLDASLRGLTELAARSFGVGRSSVWLYSDDDSEIACVDLYDAVADEHRAGESLESSRFPAYAASHRRGELVSAPDVRLDPRTAELPASYFERNGIGSLLDAPVWLGARLRGIFSLETSGGAARSWSPDDERLATVYATAVSLSCQAAERRRAQEESAKREAALRTILDTAPYPIVINRALDGALIDCNRTYLEERGLSDREALLGKTDEEITELLDPGDRPMMLDLLKRDGKIDSYYYRVRADGGIRHQLVSVRRVDYEGVDCYVSIVTDITALKNAENELRRLNAGLEERVAARTRELERANAGLLESNETLERTMAELKEAQDRMLVSEKLAALGRLMAGIGHELNTPLAALDASARLQLRYLGSGFDRTIADAAVLSEEERAFVGRARERAVSAAERLSADTVAERRERRRVEGILRRAGVEAPEEAAEDIVELGITGLAEEASTILAGPRRREVLGLLRGTLGTYRAALVMEDAVAKSSRVISALRTYARGGEEEEPGPVRLRPELSSLLNLYYNRIKRGIAVSVDVDDAIVVWGRREAINRIWFNLLNNAIQAIQAARSGGEIAIRAEARGDEVIVSIADSGPGVPADIADRVFEPFFTTRRAGEGTGLGLDIARRLARENGGEIEFTSRPGRTVFSVRLRRAPDEREGVQ